MNVEIRDLKNHVDQEVTVRGWLYNKRSSGKIQFLIIRDGSGLMQGVVVKKEVTPEVWENGNSLTQESSLKISGVIRKDDRSVGGYEMTVSNIVPVQIAEDYPITPKEHGSEFLLNNRHLWMRSSKQHAILRVRSQVVQACRRFFDDRNFVLIDSPILTPAAAEGTTTLFATDYFGEEAFLSQSGQLYLEPACMSFGKVYCFGPTFRAEKSKTRRHLTEFWMIEPEVAWLEIEGLMQLAEDFIQYIVTWALENCKHELEVLERDTSKLESAANGPYPRMSYTDAIKLLKEKGHDIEFGSDFGAPDETALTEELDKPLMVHRWPAEIKAFYMEPDPEDEKLVLGVDMLAPEGYGEIIGGSQRIGDPEKLLTKIHEHELPEEAYKWYIEIRKYGGVPHSGFGMGLERAITWITGIHHLRETIPYPRMINRLYP
jgi:asparaginyl-tRNA synthetase